MRETTLHVVHNTSTVESGSLALAIEYVSSPALGSAATQIDDHANALLHPLQLKRKDAEDSPLVFISHSLGIIVVKQALVEAKLNDKYTSILDATCLVFSATPHCGGNHATVGEAAARVVRLCLANPKNDLVEGLKKCSNEATKRFDQFRHLNEKFPFVSFFEGQPYPYGKIGMVGALMLLVHARIPLSNSVGDCRQASAVMGLVGTRETQVSMSSANHSSICKFSAVDGACELVLDTIIAEID